MEKTGRQHLLETLKELGGRELKELKAKISQVWLKRGLEGWGLLSGAKPFHPSLWLTVDAGLEVTVEGLRAVNRGDLAEELAALLDTYEDQHREQRSAASRARGRLLCTLNELGEDELGRFKVKLADMGQKGGYNPIPWGRLQRAKPAEVAAELINHYGVLCGLETAGEVLRAIRRGELAGGLAEALETYEERCREQSLALCRVREMQARTVGSLCEEDLRKIQERAAETHPQRGPTVNPWGGQERAEVMELIEELVSTYGEGHAVWMTQEMLRAVSQGPLAERLAEATGIGDGPSGEDLTPDPSGKQEKCTWCVTEEDLPEVTPELVLESEVKPRSYRVHLPGPGSFRCSETELGFEVRAAVTVQYGYGSWDWHLSAAEKQQWMVAGPLFNIRVKPAVAVAAVHLPHFLCLAGTANKSSSDAVLSQMRIAHFVDGRMTLEEPTQVRPFHAVLENPSFSFIGVLWKPIYAVFPFIPIHSVVLIYQVVKAAAITLHLYLIPNDRSLIQAVEEEEKKHQSIQVLKPPQTKPLYFGSCYTVCSSLDLEVTPEEVDFRYMSPEDQQPFMEIYTKDMREGLKLIVLMKRYGEVVWKVLVRPEDVMLSGSSSEKFKGLRKLLPELKQGFIGLCSQRELRVSPPAAWSSPAQPVDEEAEGEPGSGATLRTVANEHCDWPAKVSSGGSWEVIQRLRSELTTILQSDAEAVVSAADAHLLLTQGEYLALNRLEDPEIRVATLIDMVLSKGDQAHQLFLDCLRNLFFTFPALEPIVTGLQTGFHADVAIPRPGAQTGGPASAEGEHFVDRHRAELIQRVSMVDGVLDMLCGTVLDNEQYQSIRAERSNPEKMRKLYELMPSWNRVCKDRLYHSLKAKHKFLIEELEGK
ncbi:NACHT, LRR and PYD domains-containing protein 1-like isoform X2 [Mauremys mutica]|uniref:NACHT, LRR and PYD domains-containing protein 1-like isoform X2 n=1 Tax=Mauremys mutica TaxID=74926 RepID=UPI001D16D385|nr:NACHT, LRR and PYD domains-containing protein 1-like isoform X2 [Mauremys mutica]